MSRGVQSLLKPLESIEVIFKYLVTVWTFIISSAPQFERKLSGQDLSVVLVSGDGLATIDGFEVYRQVSVSSDRTGGFWPCHKAQGKKQMTWCPFARPR